MLGLFPRGVERLPGRCSMSASPVRQRTPRRPCDAASLRCPARPSHEVAEPNRAEGLAHALADATGDVLDAGDVPIVLGGDCSILLGNLLALRRRRRHGLLFIDGHADFYQPEAEPNGEAASMDLALATGRGPAVVADLEDLARWFSTKTSSSSLGEMQTRPPRSGSQRIEDTAITVIDLRAVRHRGVERRSDRTRTPPTARTRRLLDPHRLRRA